MKHYDNNADPLDDLHSYICNTVKSMEIFADGDDSFNLRKWKLWRNACIAEGRLIPPDEFKGLAG